MEMMIKQLREARAKPGFFCGKTWLSCSSTESKKQIHICCNGRWWHHNFSFIFMAKRRGTKRNTPPGWNQDLDFLCLYSIITGKKLSILKKTCTDIDTGLPAFAGDLWDFATNTCSNYRELILPPQYMICLLSVHSHQTILHFIRQSHPSLPFWRQFW